MLRPGGPLVAMVDLRLAAPCPPQACAATRRRDAPLSLRYKWLHCQLGCYDILAEARDRYTFTPIWRNMRYAAYWDGLMFRLTHSPRWMHHVWLAARKTAE